jgi:hypothetical protein
MESLYLSRLQLNLRNPLARRDLVDRYQLHSRLVGLFDERPVEGKPRMLWRLERDSEGVWLQAPVVPIWSRLPSGYLAETADDLGFGTGGVPTKRIDETLAGLPAGAVLRFRLATWPTYHQPEPPHPGLKPDRRYSHQGGALVTWLVRQGAKYGFDLPSDHRGVPDVLVMQSKLPQMKAGKPLALPHWTTLYEGHLVVRDPRRLATAVACGIGPIKSYGFGLLSLGRSL